MKVNTKQLKQGDKLAAYDIVNYHWVECQVLEINEGLWKLKGLEGGLLNWEWWEDKTNLETTDLYQKL